jgi:hypothetical protein
MLMYLHHTQGPFEWLVIVFFIAVALVGAVIQGMDARKRTADLQALAPQLGFDSFKPDRDHDFAAGWGFLSCLQHGDERYAFNMFEGAY